MIRTRLRQQLRHAGLALITSLTALILTLPVASATEQSRQSTSTTRGQPAVAAQYPALNLTPRSAQHNDRTASQNRHASSYNGDFWIYSAGVEFSVDHDRDGHYSSFGISFDVDTFVNFAPVYAVLYLSIDGGYWNEYAVTGDFTVSGQGSDDSVYVYTELESGYPRGYYDHLVEIYHAQTHELLTDFGPADTHSWQGLPFEGYVHDDVRFGASVSLSLSFTGAGAISAPEMALLPLAAVVARLRRRRMPASQRDAGARHQR